MDRRHIIKLQGQEFVTYEGLLHEAHQRGLKAIRTEIVQLPDASNGHMAVVRATVELEGDRFFSGIGDASPQNVNGVIARHILRMAETRAKARSLRDAVDIGMTALEELGEGDAARAEPAVFAPPPRPATERQIAKVAAEMARVGWTDKQGRDYLIKNFNKLSRAELNGVEISQLIDHLVSLPGSSEAM